jgi:hypothetical protein
LPGGGTSPEGRRSDGLFDRRSAFVTPFASSYLPDRTSIQGELFVGGEEGDSLDECLGEKKAIERVFV